MAQLIHGGDLDSARERLGQEPLDFSANLNPFGPPRAVCAALAHAAEDCAHYPDPLCRKLTRAIAAREGVTPEWVLCGNGAADLIYRLVYAQRPKRALLFEPTFAEYGAALDAVGCRIDRELLREDDGFALSSEVTERLRPDTELVFLCNPNNPTGQLTERELLERMLSRCERTGCLLAVDECFHDFLDEPHRSTMKPLLAGHPQLILFQAFTKLYCMPGLRLGYALCSDTALLGRMASCAQPWSVSAPAQRAGVAALTETEYVERTRRWISSERAYLSRKLSGMGCRVIGSHANYIFFRLPGEARLCEKLEEYGILIRGCGNYVGLGPEHYRVAVRSRDDNNRLLRALRACREEERHG